MKYILYLILALLIFTGCNSVEHVNTVDIFNEYIEQYESLDVRSVEGINVYSDNRLSSYAILLDNNGTVIEHPNANIIGTSIFTYGLEAIDNAYDEILSIEEDVSQAYVYRYEGVNKEAHFYRGTPDNILLVIFSIND